jgi:hypothetical protein
VRKQNGEDEEKRNHLTRKLMDTSARTGEVGGGRKSRRCVTAGEENDDMDVEIMADWMRACVEELHHRTAELEVVSDWRDMDGVDRATMSWGGVSWSFFTGKKK